MTHRTLTTAIFLGEWTGGLPLLDMHQGSPSLSTSLANSLMIDGSSLELAKS